ncbi:MULTISPECIES: hypothetical protein [unclassified Halomonas]|uniref:hypothetical protein n=1 Tax=unclassified Halomonas TaxID=2609666 RepID=UPI000F66D3E7|nr:MULTISPECIES: hypothetical protein [unclassified Halomonas]MBT2786425.1 hypothetical protein [Halomonas sp. ISL-106]MBT2797447.1 hypothetical protein [Halomonas sp. ISL-104]
MHKFYVALVAFLPVAAHANAVWPALYLETRLFSWWAISVGLLIEYLFVRKLLLTPPQKAAAATVTANIASAVLGVLLIPLAGIAWEVFPGLVFYHVFNMGTFNPITWCATFLLACTVNVAIEGLVYKKVFRLGFIFKSKLFLWFMLANAASVGVAMASLAMYPVQP